ncbi:TfuA-like protein [Streptomyces sp. LHD-70]|uniref:TfuA-like protein n=1 Tax=Streptomyces sp. LHD-70 TaxID=3072140 RepID=UPI00280D5639|nr:TfuA-like protein [Streptomyces sp. LHD-70]MDQ8706931.1 TfuA-like protein [Streptomyces sp. LHD-70]
MTTHVYAGPTVTVAEILQSAPYAVPHPPVRHGDLLTLDTDRYDTVVLIDGAGSPDPPVRHKEIIDVLSRGTRVIGAAGIGALRAAELWPYGMQGVGLVFGMYVQGALDADDEVAPGGPGTVALVDLRWGISNAVADEVLSAADAAALLDVAKGLHHLRRTWPELAAGARELSVGAGRAARTLRRFTDDHPELYGLMRQDALAALGCATHETGPAPLITTPAWLLPRTTHLERWRAAHRPAVAHRHPATVPERDVLRFQQLYAPDFPARWRRFALAGIAGERLRSADRGLVAAALEVAGERGIAPGLLSREAWAYWLTPAELRQNGAEARLLTLLVRSFREAPGSAPFHGVPAGLRGTDRVWADSADVVAAAVAGTADPVPDAEVRGHLEERWRCTGERELTAAARDRGFAGLAEAAEAARLFVRLFVRNEKNAADTGEASLSSTEREG